MKSKSAAKFRRLSADCRHRKETFKMVQFKVHLDLR